MKAEFYRMGNSQYNGKGREWMGLLDSNKIMEIRSHVEKRVVKLPDGTTVPCIGQGTWYMGDKPQEKAKEIKALQLGIELGMKVIDTAEMYGNGASERLVGEAIKGRRDDVFLVSKVYPHNAGLDKISVACENSLKRLGTDYLDLYLLHWRGRIPLEETIEGMEKLRKEGKILRWESPILTQTIWKSYGTRSTDQTVRQTKCYTI